MYETTYHIDTAAEILECQQKKILTEWAKGTINLVLDFGSPDKLSRDCYEKYDSRSYSSIPPWNAASITAPATKTFFPEKILSPQKTEFDDGYYYENIFHEYLNSGFYFNKHYSKTEKLKDEHDNIDIMHVYNVLLYGLWVVPYSEFSRIHVQESFTLRVCSHKSALSILAATFAPGDGSRRINAPDKKNLRIIASDIEKMRELLSGRANKQMLSPTSIAVEQQKQHGGIERFALEREKILAAALYVAHHYPKEIGKSFKSHAEAIEKHSYIFWKNEPAPDAGRIAKMISDAARPPEEWKILGGNAKAKK
ncbi:TPA: hypothetical protein H1884_004663 [Salmonella enterica]|nr:hypothetical protein [Salmonella enterica subsp. enterica serovar Florida]HAK2741747.1 hypothetical protein [Salmonella enterica]HAK2742962.1 hypothetical protein [Salmonella enterica]HAK3606562.1 hypothetical protein [Salmonella enterica]HAK3608330.1 hypothetical protein [Salmonella enterica]